MSPIDASQWTGGYAAALNLVVNASGLGIQPASSSPPITDTGNSLDFPAAGDRAGHSPGVTHRTITQDYSSVLAAMSANPGFVELVLISSTNGTADAEFVDNAQFSRRSVAGTANLTARDNSSAGSDGITWDTAVNQNWNNGSALRPVPRRRYRHFQRHQQRPVCRHIHRFERPVGRHRQQFPRAITSFRNRRCIPARPASTKTGSGSLTIANANTYTSGTLNQRRNP